MNDLAPLLPQARAAMPGLATIEAALAEVQARLRQARAAPVPEGDVVEHALATLLAGEPLPDDLGARVLAIRQANAGAMAETQVLGPLAEQLRYRERDTHAQQADAALGFLAGELDALLAKARPVLAELGDVDSADAAIAADRVSAWREAGRLGRRYEELRQVQQIITAAGVEPPDQPHQAGSNRVSPAVRALVSDFGCVRDPGSHYAHVGDSAAARADSQLGETRVVHGRVVESSHTDRPASVRPWATGDPLVDLRFVVQREDVEPWLPSIRELLSARDAHAQRQREDEREAADPPRRAIARTPTRPPVTFIPTNPSRRTG